MAQNHKMVVTVVQSCFYVDCFVLLSLIVDRRVLTEKFPFNFNFIESVLQFTVFRSKRQGETDTETETENCK